MNFSPLPKLFKLSTLLIPTLSLVVAFTVLQPQWLTYVLASQSPEVIYFVETEQPVIALTIDDGPDPNSTPKILDVLKQNNAHATFFIITNHIPGNEELVERTVYEGHELGNHLTVDEPSINLGAMEFEHKLEEADSVLSKYDDLHWFRPGSGMYNAEMLATARKHNYQTALGSIYPLDPHIPSTWFATHYILANAEPGAIIILHDGGTRGQRTAAVLATVLPELRQRGYQVVTLSQLLKM